MEDKVRRQSLEIRPRTRQSITASFGRLPPKHSVAYTIGRLKGKSAVRIHRDYIKGKGNAKGFHFWSTGYCVSTAGLDEGKVREYIRNQEETERRQEELDLDD